MTRCEGRSGHFFLLPLWEKVAAEGCRMRGLYPQALPVETNPSPGRELRITATLSHKGRGEESYADRASAPSIIAIAFGTPYTATNEPKRGPFSWPSSTW